MPQPPNPVFTPEYDHLRKVMVAARQASGLTRATVAGRMGRSRPYMVLFESGQRRIDILDFYNLAIALDCDPAELAGQVFGGFRRIQAGEGAEPCAAASTPGHDEQVAGAS